MTQTEINKLYKSIATDFKIIARKTELWDILYCNHILHDIKKLMLFQYINTVSLTMKDYNGTPLKAKKYKLVYTDRILDDRPGGIDWEDGEGHSLYVLVEYASEYHNLSIDKRNAFEKEHLKNSWSVSDLDASFPHLSESLSKRYTHLTSGIDRVDYN